MTDVDGSASVAAFQPDQLEGFRVAVTSDRRSEELIAAFERRGADVGHAPTIRMPGVQDDETLVDETLGIISARPGVLLATTSYGMRRWFDAADAAGIGDDLVTVLAGARIVVRGPKARGAIRAAGLDDQGMSERETTTSLVDLVLRSDVAGLTIAVQLHGLTDPAQLDRLRDAGATVLTVSPYRWTVHEDVTRVRRLISAICGGSVDAVTFTSAPAVDALFSIADGAGRLDELQNALRDQVVVAAVGPVTAAPLVEAGVLPIVPDRFRMGALIRLLCQHLEQNAAHRLSTDYGDVELRGHQVRLAERRSTLSPVALALFRALVTARGATVSRDELALAAPEQLDDHGVDVAVSRLRRALPEPGLVQTVIKRGYRLTVVR
ncbi:uroporphyrinogen-III synthase [Frigoribacterium sp. RIT-PI-h]|uniref:uroporphyrinogen-III synthase n=1 Tax=Frigoribacterium sp. RIT-PI-h TaxID=1690245 RepID=UPI0006B93B82|nr:uroporphyrinogen-III synthase [Frigoribacterium sp. RIT-PI-h]KPG88647.1 uroporphyrinogen III synthetase [Frigoribacterium sp. RIT-PI-h]